MKSKWIFICAAVFILGFTLGYLFSLRFTPDSTRESFGSNNKIQRLSDVSAIPQTDFDPNSYLAKNTKKKVRFIPDKIVSDLQSSGATKNDLRTRDISELIYSKLLSMETSLSSMEDNISEIESSLSSIENDMSGVEMTLSSVESDISMIQMRLN